MAVAISYYPNISTIKTSIMYQVSKPELSRVASSIHERKILCSAKIFYQNRRKFTRILEISSLKLFRFLMKILINFCFYFETFVCISLAFQWLFTFSIRLLMLVLLSKMFSSYLSIMNRVR